MRNPAVLLGLALSACAAPAAVKPLKPTDTRPIVWPTPPEILKRLRELMLVDGMCTADQWTAPAQLGSTDYVDLQGRLLLLLQVPNYQCTDPNLTLPVIVEPDGTWSCSRALEGVTTRVARGPDRALWLVTQWAVAGTYPNLWRSVNGMDWAAVPRPGREGATSLSLTQLCFEGDLLRIQLDDSENADPPEHPETSDVWAASASELGAGHAGQGSWRKLKTRTLSCDRPSLQGAWQRDVHPEGYIAFTSGRREIRVPGALCKRGDCPR